MSDQVRREVEAMDFVRQHTSIPVPSVFEIHINENDTIPSSWFSMSAIPGCPLTDVWHSMNEKARRATETELRSYLHELRAMPPPTPLYMVGGQHTIIASTVAILVAPSLQNRISTISSWLLWPDARGKSSSIIIANNLQMITEFRSLMRTYAGSIYLLNQQLEGSQGSLTRRCYVRL
jgi:hypothetical protein